MGIEDYNNVLNNRIENLNIHISVLEADILNNPDADISDKPSRQSVLNDFKAKKLALIAEKESLTNQD